MLHSNSLLPYLVATIWELPVAVAAGLLCGPFLRRVGRTLEYAGWVVAALLGVVAPLVSSHDLLHSAYLSHIIRSHSNVGFQLFRSLSQRSPISPPPYLISHHAVFINLIIDGYLVSVLAGLIRLLSSSVVIVTMVRRTTPIILDADHKAIFSVTLQGLGINNEVKIVLSSQIGSPTTLGFRKHLIIVPRDFVDQSDTEEFRAAITHECAHIRRGDFLHSVLIECLMLPVVYHPLSRVVKRRLSALREMICDEVALGAVHDRAVYARSLLSIARRAIEVGAKSYPIPSFIDSNLQERIMNIIANASRPTLIKRSISLASAALIFCLATGADFWGQSFFGSNEGFVPALYSVSSSGRVYDVGGPVKPPRVVRYPGIPRLPADFPIDRRPFRGYCGISAIVSKKGRIFDIRVTHSAGAELDAIAIRSLREWRFSPGTRHSRPVATHVEVMMQFGN